MARARTYIVAAAGDSGQYLICALLIAASYGYCDPRPLEDFGDCHLGFTSGSGIPVIG
jgi:hypothetical protein